jgi:spermidine/putrescine transport system substrate-binding protein
MKRYIWTFFAIIILALIVGACSPQSPTPAAPVSGEPAPVQPPAKPFAGQTLSLLTWEGYVPDAVKQAFEEETGARVDITYISNNGELTSKLVATGGEGYDLASPSIDNVAAAQTTYQIYQPIDISRIPNFSTAVPSMVQAVKEMSTVGSEYYSIPFTWGTSLLIVNTALVDEEINSYRQFCDPKYQGRVTHRYRYPGIVAASYALGHDLFSHVDDPVMWREILEETLEYMIDCKSNIKAYWTTRQENIDLFLSEEVWLGKGWDGTGWVLSQENPNIKAIAPIEGALGWIDTFTIPSGAENIDLAYAFIEFNYRPEIAGMVISGGGFLSSIDGSADYLSPDQAAMINETFPTAAIDNINWYPALTPELEEINSQMEERLRASIGQ